MDKPSIIKTFEEVYSSGTEPIYITIDINKILFKDINSSTLTWLPGAKETLKLLSDRKDTELSLIGIPEGFPVHVITKERIIFNININKSDIFISYSAGFRPSDYPAVKDFIIRQEEKSLA